MNSLIRYFGGKNCMWKEILQHFPNKEEYNMYIEPFGGSYGIGFHMDYIPPIEIYNDLDKNVYSLFKVISNKKFFNKFKEKCNLSYYSEDLREEFRKELSENKMLNLVDRAFYFFYVNRTSHNGIGGFSANIVVRRNMPKSISDMFSAIDNLEEFHQRLGKVIVRNLDALDLMERYSTHKNCFMYCDPPYVHSTRGTARYNEDMSDEQHERFIQLCIESKAKLLISGYDNELYKLLEENGFEKIHFNVNMTSGTHKPKTKIETLWKNY